MRRLYFCLYLRIMKTSVVISVWRWSSWSELFRFHVVSFDTITRNPTVVIVLMLLLLFFFFFLQVVVVLDYEYDYEVAKINVQWGSESPVTEIYWASEPNWFYVNERFGRVGVVCVGQHWALWFWKRKHVLSCGFF